MRLIVKFYPPDEDGRTVLPNLTSGNYRPHLVINDCTKGDLLGVQFIGCYDEVKFGTDLEVTVKLPYAKVDYSRLKPNVSFTIKEGRHSVGVGSVKELR